MWSGRGGLLLRSRVHSVPQALFRPVAMMVPDYAMIAEISLYSFGFNEASVLAKKLSSQVRRPCPDQVPGCESCHLLPVSPIGWELHPHFSAEG